ncbi:MAG: hypothetical protein NC131_09985 [Roseburia sp.]|nr:hypothetical protein [Roseburia sp.]
MGETVQANVDNDLKFRDGLEIKKPKKIEESVESGSEKSKVEYITE